MSICAGDVSVQIGANDVLDCVSVRVKEGKVIGLIGPNGAGKSTLLNVLSGDIRAQSGNVTYDNVPIEDFTPKTLAKSRAVMSQASSIVFDFTVEEILRMGWVQDDIYLHEVAEEALHTVATNCDIDTLLDRRYRTLSGGEQRRVQFARALLQIWRVETENETRYLLLDEPTANLDIAHELAVLRLAKEVATTQVGVLVVLHDLNLASRFTDELVLLSLGQIIASGPTDEVLNANQLESVYQTPLLVERHPILDRLVVHS